MKISTWLDQEKICTLFHHYTICLLIQKQIRSLVSHCVTFQWNSIRVQCKIVLRGRQRLQIQWEILPTYALSIGIKIAALLTFIRDAVVELIRNECFILCLKFWYTILEISSIRYLFDFLVCHKAKHNLEW